jgi:hypothetical protein
MLRNNKKGITPEFLAGIMIVLVGFFVVGGVVSVIVAKVPDKQADAVCKTSVAAKAKSKITSGTGEALLGSAAPVPLMCNPQEFTINAKGKTDKEIIKELMNHAARAWNVWGEGQYGGGLYSAGWFSAADNCNRYYNIKIKNLKGTILRVQVIDFMKNEIYSKTNTTYWKYIAENTAWSRFDILDDIEDQHIYSIIFADAALKREDSYELEHLNILLIADLNRERISLSTVGPFDPAYCTFSS